ncbi:cholesterol oxidase substrate-binding domain-containing protein [Alteriqipengyuania lutimaris]|uniref:FAD-binding protein n=1 Tax=Alteriqipengyuania lutimaris TaxID=1538146 RepID=A0A395LNW1_9SPHN|nr:cholesterol oxidase substrate-binding domain-containing protein [Alteriqipengyuania lutimaris]MBB3033824.1 hypothetical protein [Alteriqipengyuania lutimaris]RDS77204.1 FAD-binding protein [Alteriqipengyuania lutimaris]
MTTKPDGWPRNIKLHSRTYRNWSQTIVVDDLYTCEPADADEVAQVCNWAKDQSPPWQVRPRGCRHGWSPLTIGEETKPMADLIIMDMTKSLTSLEMIPASTGKPPMVKAGAGVTMDALLTFLQQQSGGSGTANGYSFAHTPAPGNLTVGGVLAIDGHGTAIPNDNENFDTAYGSLSNQIVSFDAVVSDDSGTYAVKTFERGSAETDALLVHAGRLTIVSATLQVIENYNLRCQSRMDIHWQDLFAPPITSVETPDSLDSFLEQSGRVEAIWYPFTDEPWLKVWTAMPTQPAGSKLVTAPYNYPFSDNLPTIVTTLLKALTSGLPSLTPDFEKAFATFTKFELSKNGLSDLWGASMNTLLYIKDETLRVTANGYAIQMKRADVQQSVHDFAVQFNDMLHAYQAKGRYPVNAPLEIRVTGLDDPSHIVTPGGGDAQTPLISALTCDEDARSNGWDCAVWFDVLTLPGTKYENDFYSELEDWFVQRFPAPEYRLMPEWSKGWAYTEKGGAWTNGEFFAMMREAFSDGRDATSDWNYVVRTMAKYDSAGLFATPLLSELFVDSL